MPAGLQVLGVPPGSSGFLMFFAAPKYKGPKSDHFDGRRFHNLQPTRHAGLRDMVKWLTNRNEGRWERWREIAVAPPPPSRVAGGELRVTWAGHATFLIQTENVNVLTDPVWSMRCSPVQWAGPKRHHAPGIRFEDLPPIDAVLISHNHYDHMDAPTLARLPRRRTFVPLGNAAFLGSGGIQPADPAQRAEARRSTFGATDLDWWESDALSGGVRVHCVPAQHFSSRGLTDRDANLWGGFVIETPHGAVYFAGDTGWGPHFAMIRERFGPIRLALLPIGAFRPEWFMCAVHISPRDAVRAAQTLEAATSIPMHYSTFHLGDDGQDEPAELLRREMGGTPFEILRPGESWSSGSL